MIKLPEFFNVLYIIYASSQNHTFNSLVEFMYT